MCFLIPCKRISPHPVAVCDCQMSDVLIIDPSPFFPLEQPTVGHGLDISAAACSLPVRKLIPTLSIHGRSATPASPAHVGLGLSDEERTFLKSIEAIYNSSMLHVTLGRIVSQPTKTDIGNDLSSLFEHES